MAKKQIQIKESELRDKVYSMVMETLKETATINEAVKRSVRKVLKEMTGEQGDETQIWKTLQSITNLLDEDSYGWGAFTEWQQFNETNGFGYNALAYGGEEFTLNVCVEYKRPTGEYIVKLSNDEYRFYEEVTGRNVQEIADNATDMLADKIN